ncbi:MerR family transcriptional regulator [Nocardia arizonensis]|uniref:MerR family transcriptional regulator n=1 Tax=Nocardia arizonensis TaxID=1141647 RepID=UPI0027D91C8D|nr:MerR family transcriptional regulator [Nocardia arizonensis]
MTNADVVNRRSVKLPTQPRTPCSVRWTCPIGPATRGRRRVVSSGADPSPRRFRLDDDIGLLAPSRVGANGYRYYEREQLLRLQQILVLRKLGLGLAEIAESVDSEPDTLAALKRQHVRLARGHRADAARGHRGDDPHGRVHGRGHPSR